MEGIEPEHIFLDFPVEGCRVLGARFGLEISFGLCRRDRLVPEGHCNTAFNHSLE